MYSCKQSSASMSKNNRHSSVACDGDVELDVVDVGVDVGVVEDVVVTFKGEQE